MKNIFFILHVARCTLHVARALVSLDHLNHLLEQAYRDPPTCRVTRKMNTPRPKDTTLFSVQRDNVYPETRII